MNFLKQISKFSADQIPQDIWTKMAPIAVYARRFTIDELSAALNFLSIAIRHGAKVEELYLSGNQLSVQQRNDICMLIPRVKHVRLAILTFDVNFFDSLRESFEQNNSSQSIEIESFDIYTCSLSEVQQIGYFKCVKYVRKLSIENEKVTVISLKELSEEISKLQQESNSSYTLDQITLTSCSLNNECLKEIATFAPFIKSLAIGISDQEAYVKGEGMSVLSEAIQTAMSRPPSSMIVCLENLSLTFTVEQQGLIDKIKMCLPLMKEVSLNRIGSGNRFNQHSYLYYVETAIKATGSATRLHTLRVKQDHVLKCREIMDRITGADGNRIEITVEAI